jgi:hypothetical protein
LIPARLGTEEITVLASFDRNGATTLVPATLGSASVGVRLYGASTLLLVLRSFEELEYLRWRIYRPDTRPTLEWERFDSPQVPLPSLIEMPFSAQSRGEWLLDVEAKLLGSDVWRSLQRRLILP